ncbi:MAG TPA: L-lactate permease [Candidatus Bathyarchaeia archaeon]|nr:L-lactate permease [Candidatus Bathyarchaeia archaeon]
MVGAWLGSSMIILPFIGALLLLIVGKWKADTTGFVMWIGMLVLAISYFRTNIGVAFIASIAGFIKSYPIALMVCTSIFMITYMQKTGALQRITVAFKTLGGEGKEPFQIMFINIGLGCFLVSIGATPVTMLPPIMLAIGYSARSSVALPSIGYDPLTTFALLAIPAVIFQQTISGLFGLDPIFPTLAYSGFIFSLFMPVVTTGIALGMLFIAGGRKMLFRKDSLLFALVGGLVAGGSAILVNGLAYRFQLDGLVPLTGLVAGLLTCLAMLLLAVIMKYKIVDNNNLTEEDIKIKESMPLWKALMPWIILVVLCGITNFIPQVFEFLFTTLSMKIYISGASPISLQVFWNAWFWVIVATVLSMPFLGVKKILKDTLKTWSRRAIRPVFAAAIFFSVAFVMTYSGATGEIVDGSWVIDNAHNMISTLAITTENIFGKYYPLIVPFVGLLGGFVSGSETSSIAMFTRFHFFTGEGIGTSPVGLVILGAANGIGGGLASVLSPAKIQNATAVIDKQGMEGEIIKKTAPIALLMVASVSIITLCWSQGYAAWQWVVAFIIGIAIITIIFLGFYGLSLLRKRRALKKEKIDIMKDEEDFL